MVDVAANRDSGLAWSASCKAAVQKKARLWMACTGIGEGVLMSEQKRLGMKVKIVDGKVKRVWEIVRELERDEARRYVEYGWRSEGVGKAMRVSERVADGLLRLLWFYGVGDREADDGDENASVRAQAGSRIADSEEKLSASTRTGTESRIVRLHRWLGIHTADGSPTCDDGQAWSTRTESEFPAIDGTDGHIMPTCTEGPTDTKDERDLKQPLVLKWDASHWDRDFLTPLNWALRV